MLDFTVFCFWFFLGCVFLMGWYSKKAVDDIRADQEERVQADDEQSEFIKQINRNNLINNWVADVKGGTKR